MCISERVIPAYAHLWFLSMPACCCQTKRSESCTSDTSTQTLLARWTEQTLQSSDQQTVGGDAVEKLLDEASYTMLEHIVYKVKPTIEILHRLCTANNSIQRCHLPAADIVL